MLRQFFSLIVVGATFLKLFKSQRIIDIPSNYDSSTIPYISRKERLYRFVDPFKHDFVRGDNITFYLPNYQHIVGKIDFIKQYSKFEYFIAGKVSMFGCLFSASYYHNVTSANILFPNNTQFELRPINHQIYKMEAVNVTKTYTSLDQAHIENDSTTMLRKFHPQLKSSSVRLSENMKNV